MLGTGRYFLRDQERLFRILDAWLAVGGRGAMLDTARRYGRNESEWVIGNWLTSRDARGQMMILTKGCYFEDGRSRVNKADLDSDLAESLEALQTDYIDLYFLHRDDPSVPVGEIMEWLNEHLAAGRFRAFGASNWTRKRVEAANSFARSNGLSGFVATSNYFGLAVAKQPMWRGCESIDRDYGRWLWDEQLPNFAWSPLSHGFFSGRFSPEVTTDADMVRTFYSETNWQRLDRATELGRRRGLSPAQVACAYVLNQDFPSLASMGTFDLDHLRRNAAAAAESLSPEEIRWLEDGDT